MKVTRQPLTSALVGFHDFIHVCVLQGRFLVLKFKRGVLKYGTGHIPFLAALGEFNKTSYKHVTGPPLFKNVSGSL